MSYTSCTLLKYSRVQDTELCYTTLHQIDCTTVMCVLEPEKERAQDSREVRRWMPIRHHLLFLLGSLESIQIYICFAAHIQLVLEAE